MNLAAFGPGFGGLRAFRRSHCVRSFDEARTGNMTGRLRYARRPVNAILGSLHGPRLQGRQLEGVTPDAHHCMKTPSVSFTEAEMILRRATSSRAVCSC